MFSLNKNNNQTFFQTSKNNKAKVTIKKELVFFQPLQNVFFPNLEKIIKTKVVIEK